MKMKTPEWAKGATNKELSLISGATRARSATHGQWQAVFQRLHENGVVDLRETVDRLFKQHNESSTSPDFLCMAGLTAMDAKTSDGDLWVVGTPLLDKYYARWSFPKDAESPQIHLKDLQDCENCKKEASDLSFAQGMRTYKRGPSERAPEDIAYPHWAKDLLQV